MVELATLVLTIQLGRLACQKNGDHDVLEPVGHCSAPRLRIGQLEMGRRLQENDSDAVIWIEDGRGSCATGSEVCGFVGKGVWV